MRRTSSRSLLTALLALALCALVLPIGSADAKLNSKAWKAAETLYSQLFAERGNSQGKIRVLETIASDATGRAWRTLADALLTMPINPAYGSLNLAQAVLVVGYEWFQAEVDAPEEALPEGRTRPATRAELENFFAHLERELDACGFLRNEQKRPTMVRNIRNLFLRAGLFEQEVQTLHGIVTELAKGRGAKE